MSGASGAITLYVPSCNQGRYLPRAIDSVLAQTRRPDQLIIIDDASGDDSPEIIRCYARAHPDLIEPIFHGTNAGIGAVRAEAVERARGELITYLDADDLYEPRKLELEERALLDDPGAGYAFSNFRFVDTDLKPRGAWYQADPPRGDLFDAIATFALARGVCHRCELVRTSIVRQVGSYKAGTNLYEDFDLKLRVARRHRAAAVAEPLHCYRVHPGGLHRVSYARHFDALSEIYRRNRELVDSLPPARKGRVRSGIARVLARQAWRAVKQRARGEIELNRAQLLRYAGAGALRRPSSLLMPKHPLRVARGLVRG